MKDRTGEKYGKLTITGFSHRVKTTSGYYYYWNVICECGETKAIAYNNLAQINSCGCLASKLPTDSEGKSYYASTEYRSWMNMLSRCTNPKHPYYNFFKDVPVEEKWKRFEFFLRDMGEKPKKDMVLARKDTSLGFNKENCHWVTKVEQMKNYRNRVSIEYNGIKYHIDELTALTGHSRPQIMKRTTDGIYNPIFTPKKKKPEDSFVDISGVELPADRLEAVALMDSLGCTAIQIAMRFNLTRQRVYQLLDKLRNKV